MLTDEQIAEKNRYAYELVCQAKTLASLAQMGMRASESEPAREHFYKTYEHLQDLVTAGRAAIQTLDDLHDHMKKEGIA